MPPRPELAPDGVPAREGFFQFFQQLFDSADGGEWSLLPSPVSGEGHCFFNSTITRRIVVFPMFSAQCVIGSP